VSIGKPVRKKLPKAPETPTLDKMREARPKSQAIGGVLEWLTSEQRGQLMLYHEHSEGCLDEDDAYRCGLTEDSLVPMHTSVEQLLADFFEIDLKEVEKERSALLDWQRELNEVKP